MPPAAIYNILNIRKELWLVLLALVSLAMPLRRAYAAENPPDEQDAEAVAIRYVRQHRLELGLTNDELQAQPLRTLKATLWTVVRFEIFYRGLRIEPATIVITVAENGVINALKPKLPSDFAVDTHGRLSQAEAVDVGVRHMHPKGGFESLDPELVILAKNAGGDGVPATTRLAWLITLYTSNDVDGTQERHYWIDANTGAILKTYKTEANAAASYYVMRPSLQGMYASGSVQTVDTMNTKTWTLTSAYLWDPCHGNSITNDPNYPDCGVPNPSYILATPGNWVGDAGYRDTDRGSPMKKTSNMLSWGDGNLTSTNRETPGSDAYLSMWMAFECLKARFKYDGLDGRDGPVTSALIHWAGAGAAQWSSKQHCIQIGGASADNYDMAAEDIVAHELGHGLSDYGPKLASTGEAGKLGEASGDIFAMIVTSHLALTPDEIPYWIGEKTLKANWVNGRFNPVQALRYMEHPQTSPGSVACYYSGIASLENHRGASPADHMFYLLVYGGASACNGNVVSSIGLNDAEQIWWSAFRSLPSLATYSDLRQQFIAAAQIRFPGPSTGVASVIDAFNAVNVTQ